MNVENTCLTDSSKTSWNKPSAVQWKKGRIIGNSGLTVVVFCFVFWLSHMLQSCFSSFVKE